MSARFAAQPRALRDRALAALYAPSAGDDGLRPPALLAAAFGHAAEARGRLAHARRVRLAAPVLSVGALGLGGEGKTPFTRWVSERLRERGMRAAVLTRGYGWVRRGDPPMALAPEDLEGASPAAEPSSIPDEALLYLRDGLAVGAHPVRVRAAAALARRAPAPDVWLLDDGFQHRSLARDWDVVLISARELRARRRPLPAGPFREGWDALHRSDRIVVTGLSERDAADLADRDPAELGLPGASPPALAGLERAHLTPLEEWRRGRYVESPPPSNVVAFSGIADPSAFERTLRDIGWQPAAHRVFPDHHHYRDADLRTLRDDAAAGATLVTTEKDAARLPAGAFLPDACQVLGVRLRVWRGEERLLDDVARLQPAL